MLRPLLVCALAATLAGACSEPPPLGLHAQAIVVGYDRVDVLDVAAVDPDRDGDVDLVVATAADVRYLEHVREERRWVDAGAGTGLAKVAAVTALHPDGEDLVVVREGGLGRLVYSGIGSWSEAAGPLPDGAPEPVLAVAADLDGDGRPDEARLEGRRLVVAWRAPDGTLVDVTTRIGASGLFLPAAGTRLIAADLEGDGDVDLLVAGGRLFALLNNGGRLSPPEGR